MEQKKQLVVEVLNRLKPYWDMAEDLSIVVKSIYCNEDLLDSITNMISKSLKIAKKQGEKSAFQKGLEAIQKIRKMEIKEKMGDEELDSLLDSI